jgi:PPM family protein phosphatase
MIFPWNGCLKRIRSLNGHQEVKTIQTASRSRTSKFPVTAAGTKSPTRVLQPAHTLRLRPDQRDSSCSDRSAGAEGVVLQYGTTDKGLVRDHNEDVFSLSSFGSKALYVVADGMGGHDAGEVASRIAMETVCKVIRKESSRATDMLDLVEDAVQQANREVQQEAAQRGSDMGTTISVALVSDGTAYIASVGDSRVYWIENGTISQITTDHSLVAKLAAAGKLTWEEARTHPKANLLYRTIGSAEQVSVDTFRIPLMKGGTLMLCTDGLWGEVTDAAIHRVCAGERDARAAGETLTEMANENGGKDNITIVIAKIV